LLCCALLQALSIVWHRNHDVAALQSHDRIQAGPALKSPQPLDESKH
jgi:hypothetical protein